MDEAHCLACHETPRAIGVLCATCAEGLPTEGLCPEQIRARRGPAQARENALLVDGFGWPHTISVSHEPGGIEMATLGRAHANDLAVAEETVSLNHAAFEHRKRTNAWFVLDAGSENGTYVGQDRVQRRYPLETGDRLAFGRRVGFLFVALEPEQVVLVEQALRWLRAQSPLIPTRADMHVDESPLRVSAVTEGGAVCSWGEERVQLSELEYELLVVLWRRWREDEGVDEAARGFVPSQQLLDVLSFKSEAPTSTNLRVLVRKVRRKMAEVEPPVDIIESRKGLGYRVARALELR